MLEYNINDLKHTALVSLLRRLDELIVLSKLTSVNKTSIKIEIELIKEEICRRFPPMAYYEEFCPDSYKKKYTK